MSTHNTDISHRWQAAAILLAAGVLVTPLGAWLFALTYRNSRAVVPTALFGFGIGFLACAVVVAVWAWRHRAEVFELHSNGIRLTRNGKSQVVGWSDIEGVRRNDRGVDNALTRWLGGNLNCTVLLTDGQKFGITGLTTRAHQLVRHIESAISS